MLELLILYTIRKREKTIYGIRKDITELFGTFTKPSIGGIYPALKRLQKAGAVECSERITDGGKKSSYFTVSKTGLNHFKELFFEPISTNPSLFYVQLQARLGTMGILRKEERKEFLNDYLKRVELFEIDINKRLNDEFTDFDTYQRLLLERTKKEVKNLSEYLSNLEKE